MAFTTLFAVSSLIKDVVIPLLAAAVTATGIVFPSWRSETEIGKKRPLRMKRRCEASTATRRSSWSRCSSSGLSTQRAKMCLSTN